MGPGKPPISGLRLKTFADHRIKPDCLLAGFAGQCARHCMHNGAASHGAHSDYCRVAWRSVVTGRRGPAIAPTFVAALQQAGWVKLGQLVSQSQFRGAFARGAC